MRSAVAIVIDGVLRREVGYQPIPEGLELYRVLVEQYNVILLADLPEADAELDHFFHTEQLHRHSMVFYSTDKDRVDQASWLRNAGHSLMFVIEADPLRSADLMEHGFNVMHFMHAQYTRPQWRPDYERHTAPWAELVARETEAKAIKATDKRTQ